jgi:hypothetical protein
MDYLPRTAPEPLSTVDRRPQLGHGAFVPGVARAVLSHTDRLWLAFSGIERRAAWCAQAIKEYRKAADVRASRSDPDFEIYAGLPLACRMASDEIRPLQ